MRLWKKWLLRTSAAVVATLVLYLVRDWVLHSRARDRLVEGQAALDAADPGWRLEQIQLARVKAFPPGDQNITKLAWKIKDDTPKAFDEFLMRANKPNPWPPDEVNRLPSPGVLADARRTRRLCLPVIERALKLGTLPGGGIIPPPVPNPLNLSLDHTQRLRHAAGLLSLNAVVLAADNDPNAAIASSRAGLNLVRGINDEPTLIAMLVRVAVAAVAVSTAERALAYGEPTAGLVEVQAELRREADEPVLAQGFRGERAWVNAIFEYLQFDPEALNAIGNDLNPLALGGKLAFQRRIFQEQAEALRIETRFLEIARGPSQQWLDRMREEDLSGVRGTFIQLLLPASENVTRAVLRSKARLRCLVVGIACERFRQANGRWPKDLAELPKAMLADVPTDPYVGELLKYRQLPDGIVIYGVGDDRTDDGGKLATLNPKPGEDVGVRLWSPKFRRADPLPEPMPE